MKGESRGDKQKDLVTLQALVQGGKVNSIWCGGHGREAQQATLETWCFPVMDTPERDREKGNRRPRGFAETRIEELVLSVWAWLSWSSRRA